MNSMIKNRFNGLLPVVVDLETSGVNQVENAILEIAAITLNYEDDVWGIKDIFHQHVVPFKEAQFNSQAMKINQINLNADSRKDAKTESDVLQSLSIFIQKEIQLQNCKRGILVGHNAHFDLNFMNQAGLRSSITTPLHPFCTLDTATLSALFFKDTVLPRALFKSKIGWDGKKAHSALYDAKKTAQFFCKILNDWDAKIYPQSP